MSRRRTLALVTLASTAVAAAVIAFAGCGDAKNTDIFDVNPRAGATQGGQPVKIMGQGFQTDIGYTVYFGLKKADNVTIADEHTLVAMTPQMEQTGDVDVMIRADNGPAWRITKGFRYEDMSGNVMEGVGATAALLEEFAGDLSSRASEATNFAYCSSIVSSRKA